MTMSTTKECEYDKINNDANTDSCTSSSVLTTLRRIHALVRQNNSSSLNCCTNSERLLLGALACTTGPHYAASKENVEAPPCFLTIVGDDNPVISIVHHLSIYRSSGFCTKGPFEGRIMGFVNSLDGASSITSALPPIVKAPALDTSASLFGSLVDDSSATVLDTIFDLWSEGAEEKLEGGDKSHSSDATQLSNFDFLFEFYKTRDHSTLIRHCELISILERRNMQSSSVQQRKARNEPQSATRASQSIIKLEDLSDDEPNMFDPDFYGRKKHIRGPKSNRPKKGPYYDLTKVMWCPREWASFLLEHSENGSTLSPYRAFHLIHDKILGRNSAYDGLTRTQLREYADPILQWLALACMSKLSSSSGISSIMDETSSFVSVKWEPIISYPPKLITWASSMLYGKNSSGSSSSHTNQIVASNRSHVVVETESVPLSSGVRPVSSNDKISLPRMTNSNQEENKETYISNQEQPRNEGKNEEKPFLSEESACADPSPYCHSRYRQILLPEGCNQPSPPPPSFDCADDSPLTIKSTLLLHHQNQATACKRRSNTTRSINVPQADILSSSVVTTSRSVIKCLGMILISHGAIYRKLDRRRETLDLENAFKCKLYVEEYIVEGSGGWKFVVAHESIDFCQEVLRAVQDRFVFRFGGRCASPIPGVHVAILTQIPKPFIGQIRNVFWSDNFSFRLSMEQLHCCQIYFAGNSGGNEGEFATTKYVEHYSKLPAHYFAHNHHPSYKSKYDLFVDSTIDIARSGDMSSTSKQTACVLVTGFTVQQAFKATLDILSELEKACISDDNKNHHHEHQQQRLPPRQLQQLQPNFSYEEPVERLNRGHTHDLDDASVQGYWPGEADGPYAKKRRISSVDQG